MEFTEKEKKLFLNKIKKEMYLLNKELLPCYNDNFHLIFFYGKDNLLSIYKDKISSRDEKYSLLMPSEANNINIDMFPAFKIVEKYFTIKDDEFKEFIRENMYNKKITFRENRLSDNNYLCYVELKSIIDLGLEFGLIPSLLLRKGKDAKKSKDNIIAKEIIAKFKKMFSNYQTLEGLEFTIFVDNKEKKLHVSSWNIQTPKGINEGSSKRLNAYMLSLTNSIEDNYDAIIKILPEEPNDASSNNSKYHMLLNRELLDDDLSKCFPRFFVSEEKFLLDYFIPETKTATKIKI